MDEATLNELLECSVCMEVLDITSKVLPCQHTFCRRCLEAILSARGGSLHCPECRTLVPGNIDDLPPNVLLVRLLETIKVSAATKGATCSTTNGQTASRHRTVKSLIGLQVPCAKALYSYDAQEACDLSFKKSDIILLDKRIDENWFEGRLNHRRGFFPAPYVQVLVPLPDEVAGCRALYDFKVSDTSEKDCLAFRKDDFLKVIRRVDDNWLEGKLGNCIGIFPVSFVELNAAAKLLINRQKQQQQHLTTSTISPASTNRGETELSSELRPTPRQTHHRSSSADLPVTNKQRPPIYEAVYDYKAQKPDELELHRGDCYAVLDKSPDGWFKGRNLISGTLGLFPGNYVRLVTLLSQFDNTQSVASSATTTPAPSAAALPCTRPYHFPRTISAAIHTSAALRRQPITNVMQARQRNAAAAAAAAIATGVNGSSTGMENSSTPTSLHSSPAHAPVAMTTSTDADTGISTWLDITTSSTRPTAAQGDVVQRRAPRTGRAALQRPVTTIFMASVEGDAVMSNSNAIGDSTAPPSGTIDTVINVPSASNYPLSVNGAHGHRQHTSSHRGGCKLGVMRRLTVPGRQRTTAIDAELGSSSVASQHITQQEPSTGENSDPTSSNALTSSSRQRTHRRPKNALQLMYRCVLAYQPQSEHELELQPGDLICVDRKHSNGWYRGRLERTGNIGLFPASFVRRVEPQ